LKKLSKQQIRTFKVYGEPHPSEKFYYVTRNPLADQTELLQQLSLAPDACGWCDLYWALGERVAFVSFVVSRKPEVTYGRNNDEDDVVYRFTVRTRITPLTSAKIERGLDWLLKWFESGARIPIERMAKSATSFISDQDILV
jgi:hypothetical protein